ARSMFSQMSLDADKRYTATLKLGITTTTGDAEGEVLRRRPVDGSTEDMLAACRRFGGEIGHTPPRHSALKRDGRALYQYAREAIAVEREARKVTIRGIDVTGGLHDEWTIEVR